MIAVPWSFVLPGNPALSQLLLSVSIALLLLSVSSFDPNRDRMISLDNFDPDIENRGSLRRAYPDCGLLWDFGLFVHPWD